MRTVSHSERDLRGAGGNYVERNLASLGFSYLRRWVGMTVNQLPAALPKSEKLGDAQFHRRQLVVAVHLYFGPLKSVQSATSPSTAD